MQLALNLAMTNVCVCMFAPERHRAYSEHRGVLDSIDYSSTHLYTTGIK